MALGEAMKVVITADHAEGDGVEAILKEIEASGYRQLFSRGDYGVGVGFVGIVIRALPSRIPRYSRCRLNKADAFFGANLRIISEDFYHLSPTQKREVVVGLMRDNFLPAVRRTKIQDFASSRFADDFSRWLTSLKWDSVGADSNQ